MFHLDNSMANLFVYGIAMAADFLADHRTHSPPNIILS